MSFIKELDAKTRTQSGAIQVLDEDEKRLESKVRLAADWMGFNVWEWSTSKGLVMLQPDQPKVTDPNNVPTFNGEKIVQKDVAAPQALLQKLSEWTAGPSFVLAKDFNSLLNRANTAPMIARQIKDLNAQMTSVGKPNNYVQLVVVDVEESQFPCGYQRCEMPLPDRKELSIILDSVLSDMETTVDDEEHRQRLLNAVSGLPAFQASNALAESVTRTNRLDPDAVSEYKKVLVQAKGLEIVDPDPRGLDALGGLEPIKECIREMGPMFDAELAAEYDLQAPKGGLFAGYPGTGKSALARAIASYFSFVLVRADLGSARGMYQGQSEQGMDEILKTAAAVAPCVLWIDEIEKALSGAGQGGQTDGGTGDRMFAKLLTFMQESEAPVFFFLTANRPDQLPSEFTRAGRLDVKFWLGLPSRSARRSILEVFTKKYHKASNINIDAIVDASDGYTGAELEVAIKGALRTALSQRAPEATTEMVLAKLAKVAKVADTFDMTPELQKWADAADKGDAAAPEETTTTTTDRRRIMRRAAAK